MSSRLQYFTLATAAVLLVLIFGAVLLIYVPPMENVSLNLSVIAEDSLVFDPEDYDDKGWTVFTRTGEETVNLTPNGYGSYMGLELGQTFYFSRVMTEELDSPVLQLSAVESTYAVWLDDTLIYTDCPELDNRIGYLTLPMNGWYRSDPIIISLPVDYVGKTLTVAQSFPDYSETGSVRACPTAVKLYCSYAYESELISESFATAFLAVCLFLLGLILLAAAVKSGDPGMLFLSLTAFLQMAQRLIQTSFFWKYFGTFDNTPRSLLPLLTTGTLLVFLTMRASSMCRAAKHGRFAAMLWVLCGAFLASIAVNGMILALNSNLSVGISVTNFFVSVLPCWLGFACLLAVLSVGFLFWKKSNRFYRLFLSMASVGIVIVWLALVLFIERGAVAEQLAVSLSSGQIGYLYFRTVPPVMIAAMAAASAEFIRTEIERRIEKRLLEERRELMLGSYENMRRQNEEVMMLRHDMAGHLEALKDLTDDPDKLCAYLDQLIGQSKKIRSVVQTGNRMLDIILNNTLSAAADAGIRLEIVKAKAPPQLPLSDSDLWSLVMNVMNNAVSAAKASGADSPYIRLDIHERSDYFAFTCENSADMTRIKAQEDTMTVPKHGLGLKIIENIADLYGGLIETEHSDTSYKVQIAIPLFSE